MKEKKATKKIIALIPLSVLVLGVMSPATSGIAETHSSTRAQVNASKNNRTFSNDIPPKSASSSQTTTLTSSQTPADESIDSWMPDKNLQQCVLNCLIRNGQLPEGSTVNDITKAVAAKNKYMNLDITLPVSNLEGLQYFKGHAPIQYLIFKNTQVLFPNLKYLNPTEAGRNELISKFDNTNFSDLP